MSEAIDGSQDSGHAAIDIRQAPVVASLREVSHTTVYRWQHELP